MASAHLVITLLSVCDNPFPRFYRAQIYPMPAEAVACEVFQVHTSYLKTEGDTYELAKDKMIEQIRNTSWLQWVLPWVDPNMHKERIALSDEMRVRLRKAMDEVGK